MTQQQNKSDNLDPATRHDHKTPPSMQLTACTRQSSNDTRESKHSRITPPSMQAHPACTDQNARETKWYSRGTTFTKTKTWNNYIHPMLMSRNFKVALLLAMLAAVSYHQIPPSSQHRRMTHNDPLLSKKSAKPRARATAPPGPAQYCRSSHYKDVQQHKATIHKPRLKEKAAERADSIAAIRPASLEEQTADNKHFKNPWVNGIKTKDFLPDRTGPLPPGWKTGETKGWTHYEHTDVRGEYSPYTVKCTECDGYGCLAPDKCGCDPEAKWDPEKNCTKCKCDTCNGTGRQARGKLLKRFHKPSWFNESTILESPAEHAPSEERDAEVDPNLNVEKPEPPSPKVALAARAVFEQRGFATKDKDPTWGEEQRVEWYYYDGVCERIVRKVGNYYEWRLSDWTHLASWNKFKGGINRAGMLHKQNRRSDYYDCYRKISSDGKRFSFIRKNPHTRRYDYFCLHDPCPAGCTVPVDDSETLTCPEELCNGGGLVLSQNTWKPPSARDYDSDFEWECTFGGDAYYVGKMYKEWKPSETWFDPTNCPKLTDLCDSKDRTDWNTRTKKHADEIHKLRINAAKGSCGNNVSDTLSTKKKRKKPRLPHRTGPKITYVPEKGKNGGYKKNVIYVGQEFWFTNTTNNTPYRVKVVSGPSDDKWTLKYIEYENEPAFTLPVKEEGTGIPMLRASKKRLGKAKARSISHLSLTC